MEIMNVFRSDAFSAVSLTAYVERNPYLPNGIGELNLFEPLPIRTTALAVEDTTGILRVIPTSARGAPPVERVTQKRKARYFDVPRLAHGDTIQANELQNVREFLSQTDGSQVTVLMQLQDEVARRMSGPTGLQANLEATWELHRLGAIQGILLDTDGSVLYNWFNEFGITAPTEVGFNLAADTPNSLRPIINAIVRRMARAAQGAFTPSTRVVALCGDTFYDQFVNHPDVIRTYINWSDATQLRNGGQGGAFSYFDFADVTWINYRGSNDNATIAIPVDKVKFFPMKAPGVFQVAYAPGESFEWINTPGLKQYVQPIIDRDRNSWWRQELYSYPLHICTRPEVLQTGRSEA